MNTARRMLVVVPSVALLAGAAPAVAADKLWVINQSNTLHSFSSDAPGTLSEPLNVTGVFGPALQGIDFRPATGELYGMGGDQKLYRIDLDTGAATAIGLSGLSFGLASGMDFNPVSDRIRIVDQAEENARINPNNGARADSPQNDTNLTPAGELTHVAYDRNVAPTAPGAKTTAFGADVGTDTLMLIGGVDGDPSPNLGAVTVRGPLGVNLPSTNGGLDIAAAGTAYLTAAAPSFAALFTVNLATGAATLVGSIGSNFPVPSGISAQPTGKVGTPFAVASASEGAGVATVVIRRALPAETAFVVDYATSDGDAVAGSDYTATSGRLTFAAGETEKTVAVPIAADGAQEPTESLRLTLTNPPPLSPGEYATAPLASTSTSVVIVDDDAPPPAPVQIPVPTPAADTAGPVILILPVSTRVASKVRIPFACSEACSGTAQLRQGTKTRRTAKVRRASAGRGTVTFTLTKALRRSLPGKRLTVRLSLEDAAGNRGVASAKLTLRRR
jgi:hypothetical protein